MNFIFNIIKIYRKMYFKKKSDIKKVKILNIKKPKTKKPKLVKNDNLVNNQNIDENKNTNKKFDLLSSFSYRNKKSIETNEKFEDYNLNKLREFQKKILSQTPKKTLNFDTDQTNKKAIDTSDLTRPLYSVAFKPYDDNIIYIDWLEYFDLPEDSSGAVITELYDVTVLTENSLGKNVIYQKITDTSNVEYYSVSDDPIAYDAFFTYNIPDLTKKYSFIVSYKILRDGIVVYTSESSDKTNVIDVDLLAKINDSSYKFSTRNNYENCDPTKLRNFNEYSDGEKSLATSMSKMLDTAFDYDIYLNQHTSYGDSGALWFDTTVIKRTINYLLSMIYQEISIPVPINLYKIVNTLDNIFEIAFYGSVYGIGREYANEIKESVYYTHLYNLSSFEKINPSGNSVEFFAYDLGFYVKKSDIDSIEIMKKLNIKYIDNFNDSSYLIKNLMIKNNKKDFKNKKN